MIDQILFALLKKMGSKENLVKWLRSQYRFDWEWKHFKGPNLTGGLVWEDGNHNIIPDAALLDILSVYLANGTQSSTWFMVPADGVPAGTTPVFAASDTPASHADWAENEDYTEGVRQTYNGVVTANNITNSVSPAVINIAVGSNFGGSALFNNNTKGGATGIMASGVVASQGNQVLGAGGSLSMVYSITSTNA